MRKLLAAVVLCVPVVSNADLLFLKYEGAVSGIEEQGCPCPQSYSIGDPVSGKLIINLALANGGRGVPPLPPDWTNIDYLPEGVSFIHGRPLAAAGNPNDAVFFYNSLPAVDPSMTYDRVEVYDGIAPNPLDMLGIQVERLSPYGQLITDVGSVQNFDVTPDDGTTITGQILRGLSGAVGAFRQTISLTFSHVSMGVCKRST
ncbi:MAG TPA: hypothetical protein VE907_09200 [Gammaproteobacteria bacterium]|nr:hypothetical protein [Gammaproteobacteria bacterium]